MSWLLIAAAAALLLAALLVRLAWRRRRLTRRRRLPVAVPRYPVVLVHGMFGFDEIRLFGWRRKYFVGIGRHLENLGVPVKEARLPPLGSVPDRAARLVDFINSLGAKRVNVIAHSMGGLDARYAIARLGAADKIASLVTIGTPHRGTPLADLGSVAPALTLRTWVKRCGLPFDSLDWLTPARMEGFNLEIADDPRVVYASVVCQAVPDGGQLLRNPLLLASHAYLKRCAGSNDGVVPASSQRWGRTLCEVQADHWAQVGWFASGDTLSLYSTIVEHLAAEGL